ncbi:phycobilisome rod-core linker polypeptide [Acaryochloris marina]|uniref:Phycobilisome rod-core linker polypeptide CpcG n=1 Tax=Acaryochloris marina (strain MBIC 11017) TaxID=329726 RepID=A8ZMI9_ACAM1|nr:phycobilisome rod-core linker polypeptide [Acaryochloris marina]ABW32400.1 phycobilisome rod-core linker polypeptide; CpcG [Acaryochloris marina MBIC11017]
MPLPLLEYNLTSQNQRVDGFEVPSDEQKTFSSGKLTTPTEIATIIDAAYLQIFHEQQMLTANRQATLESQLKAGQITVKDFIRGLILSDSFRRLNYDANNNYRFVELCFQRVLGRQVYNERETLAWSIVLATKGLQGFIDELLNTDEYLETFGEDTVPYQRRRILPKQEIGELTFAHVTRYGEDYRNKLARYSRSSEFRTLDVRSEKVSLFLTTLVIVVLLGILLTLLNAAPIS